MNNVAGAIGWLDLTVPDAERIRDFYAAVVGWTFTGIDMEGGYQDYGMDLPGTDETIAGICHAQGMNADLPPVWMPYFLVDDLQAAIKTCSELGASFLREPEPDASVVYIRDPTGVIAALFQRSQKEEPFFEGVYPISGDYNHLPVLDLAPAIAFYTRLLGFKVVSRESDRVVLQRDQAVIGLSKNGEDPQQASCYFAVRNVEALHQELTAASLEPTGIRIEENEGKRSAIFFAKEPYGVCFCFGGTADA